MMRRIGFALLGAALMVAASAGAHAALSASRHESTLEDVVPAAVLAARQSDLPPIVRESLRRQPRLSIPLPGFGEFGREPLGGAEAGPDEGVSGLFRMRDVDDAEGPRLEVQP